MIAETVYGLCAATSALCAVLLWRAYARSKVHLLFWCSLGFIGLCANNILLFADRILLPALDLSIVRIVPGLLGLAVLCFGLIWATER